MNEYIGIGVSFVLAAGIAGAMVFLSSVLGKKNPTSSKLAPFECGKDPFSLPMGRLAIKFYLTAILFILFDVELVFLYPLAVVYRQLGFLGLTEKSAVKLNRSANARNRLAFGRPGERQTLAVAARILFLAGQYQGAVAHVTTQIFAGDKVAGN